MSAAVVTVRPPTALALLLMVAAVLLIGSGVSYTLLQTRPGARALPVEALYSLALDASASVAGDEAALARFQQRQKELEDTAAHDPAAPFTSDARFTRLMSNATAVLRARSALADAGSARAGGAAHRREQQLPGPGHLRLRRRGLGSGAAARDPA